MPNAIRFNRGGTPGKLTRLTNLPANNAVTLMAWVYVRSSATGGNLNTMLRIGAAGAGNMLNLCENGGKMAIYDVASPKQGATALPLNTWVHLTMTCDGSNALGYFNGALDLTVGSPTLPTVASITSGDSYTADPYDGDIAAIKIWNRVLSASEIPAEVPYAIPILRDGLNSAYPMASEWDVANSGLVVPRASTSRWPDVSGGGYEWTESGNVDSSIGPPIQYAPTRQRFRARYHVPVAGGGTNVTPGVGQLTLTGFAPTVAVSSNQNVAAGVGALALAGFAPTVGTSNNQNVLAGVGALTLAGFAPSVVVNTRVLPGAGVLALTGFAPTVALSDNKNVLAGVGALALSGFAPLVSIGTTVAPGVGQLLLTGFAPTIGVSNHQNVVTGLGALVLAGYAPTVFASNPTNVSTGLGQLTLSGFSPTITITVPIVPAPVPRLFLRKHGDARFFRRG